MPPPGGFEPLRYKRNLPLKGPSGLVLLTSVMAICSFGLYRVGQGNIEKRFASLLLASPQFFPYVASIFLFGFVRELAREKAWSRIHLIPMLMAEGDRDTYRRQQANIAREREIMKDVPGWEVRNVLTFRIF